MKVNMQRPVRGDADQNVVVLSDRDNTRVRGCFFVMNVKLDHATFSGALLAECLQQYSDQQSVPRVARSHGGKSKPTVQGARSSTVHRLRIARIFSFTCLTV